MIREEFGVYAGGHHSALYHRMYYNRRGQMFDTRLGTDSSSAWDVEDPTVWRWANGTWNRGALRLYYSASLNDYDMVNPSQPDNNGNIHRMEHFVPNALDGSGTITSWVMGTDAYTYDEVNRLTQVTETPTGGSGPGFTQKFIYDRWGNRKIDTVAISDMNGGVTDMDCQITTTNNRMQAPTDTGAPTDKMRYDAAGNLIWDEYTNAANPARDFGYDVDNRIGVVKNASGVELARYIYDPDGRRVRRIVSGVETWLVYGFEGELIAEYAFNVGSSSPQKEYGYRGGQLLMVWDVAETGNRQWQWLVSDHLGSPRMVVDRGGEVSGIRRRDFLPFGEELASSIGHRNAAGAGYTADNVRQKLGSKERDTETGLDYFNARYFASVQGRFTSPDEPLYDQYEGEPQSWNLYSYVRNSPLVNVDPNGKETCYYQDGKQIACDNAKGFSVKDNVLTYKGKSYDLGNLEAQTVVRASGIEPGHEQRIPYASVELQPQFDYGDRTGARSVVVLAGTMAARPPYNPQKLVIGSGLLLGAGLVYLANHNNLPPPLVNPISLNMTDKIGKIASDLGWTEEQVRKAIHKVKQNLKGGPIKNPDVVVDTTTGEVYPKNPDGTHGDSIGNIHDP